MSLSAFESLNAEQKLYLESQNKMIIFAIPTIEKNGGGSVRCMMAEVFTSVQVRYQSTNQLINQSTNINETK